MIVKCESKDKDKVLSYIGSDYPYCLYLYLDLIKYGFDSDNVDVYAQYDGEAITAVLLKYYSCLHVFTKTGVFDAGELAAFFLENDNTMLYCTAQTAETVYSAFPRSQAERAVFTKGWVAQVQAIDKESKNLSVPAKENDFSQIVRLIYSDEDIGRSYRIDELARQLEERNTEGYARNRVIKINGEVVAHACTNAEINNIAVVAELIVKDGYRKKGYASDIFRGICQELLNEGKEVYSFYYSEESRSLHKHIGFYEVCEWAKVVMV